MNKTEIQAALDKATRTLGTATRMNMPKTAIDKAQSEVDKYTKMLADYKDEPATEKTEKVKKTKADKKAKPAKAAKKSAKKLKSTKAVSKSEKTVEIKGKIYTNKDKEFCDMLLKKWNERKASMKKSSKKFKTKTISHKIGADIASAVNKTIDYAFKKHEKLIDKNPQVFIKRINIVYHSAIKLAAGFKSILGDDYKSSQIKTHLDEIQKHINSMKSKINKK